MNVEELKTKTNDKVMFDSSRDSLLIKSLVFRYADFLRINDIHSIEMESNAMIRISIPRGSSMGDHDIAVDLKTGKVTADGKVFDEALPDCIVNTPKSLKRKRSFTPTINGFSIKDVHTMPSEDGYACYCKVYFNGEKVGDFVDKGDGSEYSFYADPPYSAAKIESVIRSFPSTERDYGFGPMEVPYYMNQMVNDLMEMKEIAKELKRLEGSGRDYVVIDEWKTGKHLSCSAMSSISDEELADKLDKDLSARGLTDYEINRYRSLEDLNVINSFVCDETIKRNNS